MTDDQRKCEENIPAKDGLPCDAFEACLPWDGLMYAVWWGTRWRRDYAVGGRRPSGVQPSAAVNVMR